MLYYDLADQEFKASSRASVGIYNVSTQLAFGLSKVMPCTMLMNEASEVPALLAGNAIKKVNGGANGFRRVAWDQWGLYGATEANRSDWIFSPKGFSSFIRKPPCPLAVYVHDVVYSYWRRAYPGYRSHLLHTYFDLGLKATLLHADVVFVNSEFTAQELQRFARDKNLKKLPTIVKAGIGFDHLQSAPCEMDRSGILVYVSSWPHKGSAALLDKLARWQRETGFSEPVYFIGDYPPLVVHSEFPNWAIIDTLPEKEYRDLLGRVRCSIFNSEYEGFGMPPGEAIVQGTVPVYSSIPALKEVMGGVGYSYDNSGYVAFAEAVDSALSVSHDQLAEWKKGFLDKHHWSNVIGNIIALLG